MRLIQDAWQSFCYGFFTLAMLLFGKTLTITLQFICYTLSLNVKKQFLQKMEERLDRYFVCSGMSGFMFLGSKLTFPELTHLKFRCLMKTINGVFCSFENLVFIKLVISNLRLFTSIEMQRIK